MMSRSFPYRPALVVALLAGGGAMLSMWMAYRVVEATTLEQETQQLQRQLELQFRVVIYRGRYAKRLPTVQAAPRTTQALSSKSHWVYSLAS